MASPKFKISVEQHTAETSVKKTMAGPFRMPQLRQVLAGG